MTMPAEQRKDDARLRADELLLKRARVDRPAAVGRREVAFERRADGVHLGACGVDRHAARSRACTKRVRALRSDCRASSTAAAGRTRR